MNDITSNIIDNIIRNLTKEIPDDVVEKEIKTPHRLIKGRYKRKLVFLLFRTRDPVKLIEHFQKESNNKNYYENEFCIILSEYENIYGICYGCKGQMIKQFSDKIIEYKVVDAQTGIMHFFHPNCMYSLSVNVDKIIIKLGREEFNKRIYNMLLFNQALIFTIIDVINEVGRIFINIL